jgi:hypothetical protein
VTLQHFLPRPAARAAPVLLTLAVAAFAWWRSRTAEDRARRLGQVSGPFAVALMGLSICFGTMSYEYHTVALLGLIPALVLWIERSQGVEPRVKAAAAVALAVLLGVTFRVYGLGTYFKDAPPDMYHGFASWIRPPAMTAVYAAFAVLFLALSLRACLAPRPTDP